MEWFMNNLSTIIISIIVFAFIAFLVYRVVKAKLSKQSMCSGCSDAIVQVQRHAILLNTSTKIMCKT